MKTQTIDYMLKQTPLGMSLLNRIQATESDRQRGGRAVIVGFFPASREAHDYRVLRQLTTSALAAETTVAVLDLSPAPATNAGEATQTIEMLAAEPNAPVPDDLGTVVRPSAGGTGEIGARDVIRVALRLAQHRDLVVVVGPPVLEGNLAGTLAKSCDQTYLMVRQQETTKLDVERSVEKLKLFGAHPAGVLYLGRKRLIPQAVYSLFFGRRNGKR